MNISHIGQAAVVSATLAILASCGGSSESSDPGAGGSTGDFVSVASVDGRDVLVDAQDHTLYTVEVEQDGKIHCVDACTSFWEPVIASAADVDKANTDLSDALDIVNRPDGDSQLTYNDLPLYTFAEEGAGELTGDGFTDDFQGTEFVWEAATTDESPRPADDEPSEPSDTPDSDPYGY